MASSAILVAQHEGEVPSAREALEALPGIGRKSANVILNSAFRQNTIGVDTHVFRVANRTGIAPGKTPLAVEKKLERVIPKPYRKDAHHWLVLHGRYICQAKKPLCGKCSIEPYCTYKNKKYVALISFY
jgi:endonuclease-3